MENKAEGVGMAKGPTRKTICFWRFDNGRLVTAFENLGAGLIFAGDGRKDKREEEGDEEEKGECEKKN